VLTGRTADSQIRPCSVTVACPNGAAPFVTKPDRTVAGGSFTRRPFGVLAAGGLAVAILAAASPGRAEQVPAAGPAPAQQGAPQGELRFEPFHDDSFIAARKSGNPVVLYFEADWCAPCKEMHDRTFRDPVVLAAAAGMRLFRVDMTHPDPYHALLVKSFDVPGEPTIIVFGPDGAERLRRFGFVPPEVFANLLRESRTPRPAE
jgi:thiol:disulfide interchange protein